MDTLVLELDGYHNLLDHFGTWRSHTRRPNDLDVTYSRGNGGKARFFRTNASAPTSPPERFGVLNLTRGAAADSPSRYSPAKPVSKSGPTSLTRKVKSPASSLRTITIANAQAESTKSPVQNQGSSATDGSDAMSSKSSSPSAYTFTPVSSGSSSLEGNTSSNPLCARPPKRRRHLHDVDGPRTGHMSCKKRRLRLDFITSRLSQPYSLPATHILNRESGEDTPMLSRFLAFAAMGAKKAGHQTALVRKAAILNRARLNLRQVAANRGHERMWRMAGSTAMGHGIQLVTGMAGTGAMFPGRPGAWEHVSVLPALRAHTKAGPHPGEAEMGLQYPGTPPIPPIPPSTAPAASPAVPAPAPIGPHPQTARPAPAPRLSPMRSPPGTSIMTPMTTAEDDEESFPAADIDMSDDDMGGVYADFETMFGGGAGRAESSPERDQDDHFYEEYLDELDGIGWMH